MFWHKKKPEKVDLLALSDSERTRLIEKIKQRLQEKIRREKSLRHLLEAEKITVKGNVVYDVNEPLRGVTLSNKL